MARSISPTGFAMLQSFEGFRAEPLKLGDGRYLVGYGHVQDAPPPSPLSERDAEALLREDLRASEAAVADAVLVPLEQSQFDALTSFAFSVGPTAFLSSEALALLNAGDLAGCAEAMRAWRFGSAQGKPQALLALTRRRALECALLLDAGPRAAAPSMLIRPQLALGPTDPVAGLSQPDGEQLVERLRRILAAEPATARTLQPPPPELEEEDEGPPPPSSLASPAAPQHSMIAELAEDRVALSALALAGVVVVLIGFGLRAGLGGPWGDGVAAMLAAPGGALTLGALYLLLLPLVRSNSPAPKLKR